MRKAINWSGNLKEWEKWTESTNLNPKLLKWVERRLWMAHPWDFNKRAATLLNLCTNTFNVIDLLKKPGWNPYWKIKAQTNSTHETLCIEHGDPTAQACWRKNSHKSCAQVKLTGVYGPEDKHRESGLGNNGCQTCWTKATATSRWWWEKTLSLTETLTYAPLFTQEMKLFSASPARIAILWHTPEQTWGLVRSRNLGPQQQIDCCVKSLYCGNISSPWGACTETHLKWAVRSAKVCTRWACNARKLQTAVLRELGSDKHLKNSELFFFCKIIGHRISFGNKGFLRSTIGPTVGFKLVNGKRKSTMGCHKIKQHPKIPVVKMDNRLVTELLRFEGRGNVHDIGTTEEISTWPEQIHNAAITAEISAHCEDWPKPGKRKVAEQLPWK